MAEVPRIPSKKHQDKQFWRTQIAENRSKTLDELRALMQSDSFQDRKAGLNGAAWAIANELAPDIVPFLHHSQREIQETAAFALARLPDFTIPWLSPLPQQAQFPDDEIAVLLIKRMKLWGNPVIDKMLAQGNKWHMQIAYAVCAQRRYCPVEVIRQVLINGDAAKQDGAIRLLGHAGGPNSTPFLVDAISNPKIPHNTRIETALTAQARIFPEQLYELLTEFKSVSEEAAMLATALSKVGDKRIIPLSEVLARSENEAFALQGITQLRRLKAEQSLELFPKIYKNATPRVQAEILDSIGRFRQVEFISIIKQGLASENDRVNKIARKVNKKYHQDEQFAGAKLPSLD